MIHMALRNRRHIVLIIPTTNVLMENHAIFLYTDIKRDMEVSVYG